jgi:muramoyltetrapeptide carboxypeptidase LdcA involved in peptidoglycan recycling
MEVIGVKYNTQIKQYENKGLNALTKKLIEKAKGEMAKAQEKRRVELQHEMEAEIQTSNEVPRN